MSAARRTAFQSPTTVGGLSRAILQRRVGLIRGSCDSGFVHESVPDSQKPTTSRDTRSLHIFLNIKPVFALPQRSRKQSGIVAVDNRPHAGLIGLYSIHFQFPRAIQLKPRGMAQLTPEAPSNSQLQRGERTTALTENRIPALESDTQISESSSNLLRFPVNGERCDGDAQRRGEAFKYMQTA